MKATRGPLTRIRAAIDGWVRSFSLRDADLYSVPGDSVTGVAVTAKSVMQLDAVWSCVRLISETIATLPLSMHERLSTAQSQAIRLALKLESLHAITPPLSRMGTDRAATH